FQPIPSRYQPIFRFFSQSHHDISQSFVFSANPTTISANLSFFQPNPSRYQPIFRFFSQTHHDISQSIAFSAKPITISAKLLLPPLLPQPNHIPR
ncbi:MAG: hypothetical protein E6778_19615, partial [Niallia nealsonii]|nr:hypothetical protein [Niallia nealsonii]